VLGIEMRQAVEAATRIAICSCWDDRVVVLLWLALRGDAIIDKRGSTVLLGGCSAGSRICFAEK
jgi:hypothetical protein